MRSVSQPNILDFKMSKNSKCLTSRTIRDCDLVPSYRRVTVIDEEKINQIEDEIHKSMKRKRLWKSRLHHLILEKRLEPEEAQMIVDREFRNLSPVKEMNFSDLTMFPSRSEKQIKQSKQPK